MIRVPPLLSAIGSKTRSDIATVSTSKSRVRSVVSNLVEQIRSARTIADVAFRPGPTGWPPMRYERIGGLWPTAHRLRTRPDPPTRAVAIGLRVLKLLSRCVDFNFYCNAWIFQNMVEARDFAGQAIFTDEELARTADAMIRTFRDPADPRPAAVYFWPQNVPSAAGGTVTASVPTNLAAEMSTLGGAAQLTFRALSRLGLAKRLANSIPFLHPRSLKGIMRSIMVPADFDDASLFLSIGLQITKHADRYPTSSNLHWPNDVGNFVALLLRCAYRPFSRDLAQSTIDTRTYYWLRHFLRETSSGARQEGREPSLILPVTWIQTLEEARRATLEGGPHRIPKWMNNVDASVCTNVLHALTLALPAHGTPQWLTSEVEQLYADTARLVAWAIESGAVTDRPDLALVYYPDVETFYWFAARTLSQMRIAVETGVQRPMLKTAREGFERAMSKATQQLVESASNDEDGLVYWDGVLGNGNDRVYITAAAVNALCEVWTIRSDGTLRLAPDTPEDVRRVLRGAREFLVRHSTSGKYPLQNAFFTGSIKSGSTLMWRYPANTVLHMDGRKLNPKEMRIDDIVSPSTTLGMTGLIPEEEYQGLLAQRHFGIPVSVERSPLRDFYHWSDSNVIRSLCLLALLKSDEVTTNPESD
jgi:hypothetical protein